MSVQPVNSPVLAGPPRPPCLLLGPRGERCDRPAGEDGFCPRHSPDGDAGSYWALLRPLGAALLLTAILWPLLADLLKEIARWFR